MLFLPVGTGIAFQPARFFQQTGKLTVTAGLGEALHTSLRESCPAFLSFSVSIDSFNFPEPLTAGAGMENLRLWAVHVYVTNECFLPEPNAPSSHQ